MHWTFFFISIRDGAAAVATIEKFVDIAGHLPGHYLENVLQFIFKFRCVSMFMKFIFALHLVFLW